MPAISYNDFSGGLDRRLPINVQEANRLWTLKNAYITTGKRIRKRPGLRLAALGLPGSFGVKASNGALNVFAETGDVVTPVVFLAGLTVNVVYLDKPPAVLGLLSNIASADLFGGYLYVVAQYTTGETVHHYVDGATTYITDVNCPHSVGITKAASRIFAPSGENVRYCAAGDPRDWTTASDAGFLPAGLQQNTKSSVTACGTYEDSLVVFFSESAQIWDVAVDPSANKLRKVIHGVGTKSPLSMAGFASDIMFLSPHGFRSMRVQQASDRIDDVDTGVPIDPLAAADLAVAPSVQAQAVGSWIPEFGQYWCHINPAGSPKCWVYTFSRTSKIACWSEYTWPIALDGGFTTLDGKVYARSNGPNVIFEVTPAAIVDDFYGPFSAEVQMAFQDAKTPGVAKQFYAMDVALQGSWDVAFKYDPRDTTKEAVAQTLSSDTRPGDMSPVELVAPAIAPVFRHASAEEAPGIDSLSLYYHVLGTV